MAINSTHKRISTSTGKNAPMKKDGIAKASIHDSMIPGKLGKPYSGPPMAQGKF